MRGIYHGNNIFCLSLQHKILDNKYFCTFYRCRASTKWGHMDIRQKISLVTVLVAIAGCAASGTQVSESVATQFKDGVTRESEIVSRLGKPNSVTLSGSTKTIAYVGVQFKVKTESFVPFIGPLVGGSDYQVTKASYEIEADGVLQKITYSTQNGSSRSGINPATVDTTGPNSK